MDGSNKWCSRRDLGGNVGTKYQSVCSAPVWEAVCSTASTCRILFYSSSRPLSKAFSKSISNRLDSVWCCFRHKGKQISAHQNGYVTRSNPATGISYPRGEPGGAGGEIKTPLLFFFAPVDLVTPAMWGSLAPFPPSFFGRPQPPPPPPVTLFSRSFRPPPP